VPPLSTAVMQILMLCGGGPCRQECETSPSTAPHVPMDVGAVSSRHDAAGEVRPVHAADVAEPVGRAPRVLPVPANPHQRVEGGRLPVRAVK